MIFLQLVPNSTTMKSSDRAKQGDAFQLIEPELILSRQGDGSDPRLTELVRLLARRAARPLYEEQMKGRRPRRY